MNIGACVGLKETLAANRSGNGGNTDHYPMNQYIGKSFFDDENYRAALERLDGGYDVSIDLIEWMQDYCDNEREQARNLISYAEKWTTRLKQQASISSYHTTKRAQLDVVRMTKELARLKESICNEVQKVIEKYRNYINETYISERFRPGRKHRRTHEFKKQFKSAYTSLREVSDELEILHVQEKKAREAVRTAESAYEILELDSTTSDKQRTRAHDILTKKRENLDDIKDRLSEAKDRLKAAKKTYRIKAMEIFKQCQHVEEERLDQIRETLLDFIQAINTQKYSNDYNTIFDGLTKKVTNQQNSFDDLLFWAKTYGIESRLTKSLNLNVNENETNKKSTTVQNDTDEDEPSAALSSSTPVKTKPRRPKSTALVDKKSEPSTTMNNVLNRV